MSKKRRRRLEYLLKQQEEELSQNKEKTATPEPTGARGCSCLLLIVILAAGIHGNPWIGIILAFGGYVDDSEGDIVAYIIFGIIIWLLTFLVPF